ncbi:urea transport protein [Verticillium alfalfae VaMs.102]|uniref:Urea transport protein n=1 Tax=Verticillium alfalfae (strain VaMs.102 / ATCC MYA-4576 / FGSC 10136) TaxID=526221 RepID=C9SC02_VERA1|nr:urea transport protein [Verticillium alfalfae VaMs.102]EEY15886.1 urea transport protein [Verticillium alfalfae VaMs.102]
MGPSLERDAPPEAEEDAAHYGRRLEVQRAFNFSPSVLKEEKCPVRGKEAEIVPAGLGSSVLFAYPELATITGVQGVIVYALSSSLPLLIFAALGSIIRRKTPEGFVLTEWTRQRYGTAAMLYLSAATLFTLFLYLTAELSAIGQVVTTLTGVNQLPVMLVQVAVTTIYTSLGGFKISFVTDNIQGGMVICLIVIAAATIGALTDIDTSLIRESEFLKPTLLGWQLLYILPVCILTNNFFLSNYWLRAFASKTDKDLWIGVSLATTVILGYFRLGCLLHSPGSSPSWVIGVVLVMVVTMSCSAFDTLQSAMVSSASNDLFRNRLNIWWIRAGILLIIIPAIVIALEAPSVLQIYLISDLVSACIVPVLCIGLSNKCYWWRGFEVIVGGLGGILTSFLFGVIYYDGDVHRAGNLLLISEGLYADDWSVFGVFVAAPVGSIVWGFAALACRLSFQYIQAKRSGCRFDALDRPYGPGFGPSPEEQAHYRQSGSGDDVADVSSEHEQAGSKPAGKFF